MGGQNVRIKVHLLNSDLTACGRKLEDVFKVTRDLAQVKCKTCRWMHDQKERESHGVAARGAASHG